MPYDQELKELLRIFFAAFMESFFPDEAAHLDLSRVIFLEKEAATDVGRGRRREMDRFSHVGTTIVSQGASDYQNLARTCIGRRPARVRAL